MEFVVLHGERQERVRVQRAGESDFEVEVGERTYRVDAVSSRGPQKSLRIDGTQHEVSTHARGEGRYEVGTARGTAGQVAATVLEVLDPLTHLAQESRGGKRGGGPLQVAAYMPGRVVTLLVEEGAEVEDGQGILVLEAMKMENEIKAERAGVVRKFLVEPGQSVNGGDPLFELV